MTGWNLPPGCTIRMIDEATGVGEPCAVCGQDEDDCCCPECPICGGIGDQFCYEQHSLITTPQQDFALFHAHLTWACEARAEAEEWQDAYHEQGYWEFQPH